ncbi:MAG: hypothetical protein IIC84_08695 [Chloroflexi bacterium]|nr:hypothetical protein [Chloroflexota bacterium]
MIEDPRDWIRAVEQTWVVRFPKQHLATFGTTNIAYYVVTEPIYQEPDDKNQEGVVRTGRVIAERPSVITPTYAMNLEGFRPEAYEYLEYLAETYGSNSSGILYQFKNEADKTDIVGGATSEIAEHISKDLDRRNENMAVVMVGVDEFWDLALLKFMYEFTSSSAAQNVQEFQAKGLLEPQANLGGVPRVAVQQIERLFRDVERGGSPDILKRELDRWGLFKYYESRFLNLFRRLR